MAISLQQTLSISLFGDGVSAVFSYDLSKPPVSSGSSTEATLSVGVPSSVVPLLTYQESPQIGVDVNGNPIYDQPPANAILNGTTLSVTFGAPLKQFGSTFTDGQNNQWQITPYTVLITFIYNSLS